MLLLFYCYCYDNKYDHYYQLLLFPFLKGKGGLFNNKYKESKEHFYLFKEGVIGIGVISDKRCERYFCYLKVRVLDV